MSCSGAPPLLFSSPPPRSALARRCGTNALPLRQTPRTATWSCGKRNRAVFCCWAHRRVRPISSEEPCGLDLSLVQSHAGKRIDSPTAWSPPPRRPPPAAARESPAGGAGGRIPMWYSTRPPVAASFAILLALLFFSPVASAGTISRLACEYARSHL